MGTDSGEKGADTLIDGEAEILASTRRSWSRP